MNEKSMKMLDLRDWQTFEKAIIKYIVEFYYCNRICDYY